MWNITNELIKREQGLLKRSFINDCYGSKFMLDSLETSYVPCESDGQINFNQNGDTFGFARSSRRLDVWATFQREQKFSLKTKKPIKDFKFLNNFNNQNDMKVAVAGSRAVEFYQLNRHYKEAVFISSKTWIQIALCPFSEFEIFLTDSKNSIYQIDLRVGATIVESKKYENFHIYNLIHDPCKPELCTIGSEEYVRIFDTRNLNKPLKEHKFGTQSESANIESLPTCSYNFDGSEILVTDHLSDLFLIFNDNSGKTLVKYEGRYSECPYPPQFFGPKSEYFVYLRWREGLLFNDKTCTRDIAVKFLLALDDDEMLFFGRPAIHPNQPIVITDLHNFYNGFMFCAPKGTYDDSFFL